MSVTDSLSDKDVDVGAVDHSGNIRANPVTIQWLLEHFEPAEGVSLPRSNIFSHYLKHCDEKGIDAMNPATFGKTIRAVFAGLRSRRLGTRGHSRYHYYGLRIKSSSLLADVASTDETCAMRSKPNNIKSSRVRNLQTPVLSNSFSPAVRDRIRCTQISVGSCSVPSSSTIQAIAETVEQLETTPTRRSLPALLSNDVEWEKVDALVTRASIYPITTADLRMFRDLYRRHCEAIFDAVLNLKFGAVESLWSVFWRSRFDEEAEKFLPFDKFYLVIGCQAVQDLIIQVDIDFFHSLVQVLIPDVLRPIPGSLTQIIRNFAKSLEGWVRDSMSKMPRRLLQMKLLAASALAQTLRRYTSLNHLAQAARTVLTNQAQTSTMLADISRLDMNSIYEQGSLLCPCDYGAMKRYSDEFKGLLNEFDVCDRWPTWIDKVLDAALDQCPKASIASASQEFCQKWSYFSSLVIRDLTLRSAASFGSFHLIRLLFDEYVVYKVEIKSSMAVNISSLHLFFNHLTQLHPFSDSDTFTLPARSSSSSTCTSSASSQALSHASRSCSYVRLSDIPDSRCSQKNVIPDDRSAPSLNQYHSP